MPDLARLKRFALTHVWLLPILALALWLRLSGLGGERLYGDEAEYAIVARYLSRDWAYLAYPDITGMGAVPFVSQPPLVLYVMSLFMRVMGPTDMAALLPSVLFGVATVAVVYAIGHRLGGRFSAIGAAAILAVLPFHVQMSRKAMLDAGYVFFLMLTAYFCVAWLQTRTRRSAIGVGVGVACAALAKLPGILAAPLALFVFGLGLVLSIVEAKRSGADASTGGARLVPGAEERSSLIKRSGADASTAGARLVPGAQGRSSTIKETLKQGGLGMAPVAVGAMLYLALLVHLSAFMDFWIKLVWQYGRVSTSHAVVQEVAAVARPASWYFTDPKFSLQAEIMPLVFAFAIVGLCAALVRLVLPGRRPERVVVPLFGALVLAFFLYSDRKEGFYLLPLAPIAALLVAEAGDGLRALLAWGGVRFAPSASRRLAIAAAVMAVLLVGVPAYAAASKSVDRYARGNDQERFFGAGTKEAADWIHEQDPNAQMYGTLLGRFALHWYNEQDCYHWYIDHTFVEDQVKSGKLKYVVYEEYLGLAFDRDYERQLIDRYHGQAVKTWHEGWGEVTVYELHP